MRRTTKSHSPIQASPPRRHRLMGRNTTAILLSCALLAGAAAVPTAAGAATFSPLHDTECEATNLTNSAQGTIPTEISPPAPVMPTAYRRTALDSPMVYGRSRVYYPYPWGAMAVSLYKDGRRVLVGEVADIMGTVYVPVQRYADLFGSFRTTYEAATESVTIRGDNLLITVRVGDPYITVNDRIFYTGSQVLSLGGWIFVPIKAMSKALGASVYIKNGYYEAYVTSGDPTATAWGSSYYDSTELYWLSRIISAEARGEPLSGQIAVGNVVLNRKRSSSFPNTVKDVIFDKKHGVQFSPVSNGTIYQTPTASAVIAAKACLEGYSFSSRILYFFNPALTSATWISQNRPYIMTIGRHKFYG